MQPAVVTAAMAVRAVAIATVAAELNARIMSVEPPFITC
ncbi:hypothetical protein SMICM17S_04443 [Streptomyces microflavus]